MNAESKKRSVIIGVDGGTKWIVDELNLKGFNELRERGYLNELSSLLPFQSEPSWPSIYTGSTPNEHEIIEFFYLKKDYEKEYKFFDPLKNKPFWDKIPGKKIVLNPPLIIKPYNINGGLVTGWPYEPIGFPEEIDSLRKKFGYEGEEIDGENLLRKGDRKGYEMLLKRMHALKNLSSYLLKNYDFSLMFSVFSEMDRAQHFSLGEKDWKKYTMPFYKEVDGFLRECMDEGIENIFVIADHGFQKMDRKFLINTYLVKKGFASLKQPGVLSRVKYSIREHILRSRLRQVYDKSPAVVREFAKKIFVKSFASGTVGYVSRIHSFDFDMKKTKIFASVSNSPVSMLFVNDERFEKGAVKKNERDKLIKEVKKALENVKDGNKKVVKKIVDGRKYYYKLWKANKIILPDLLVVANKGYFFSIYDYNANKIIDKPEYAKGGDHADKGLFGCYSTDKKVLNFSKRLGRITDFPKVIYQIYK